MSTQWNATQPCRFYARGQCRNGAACKFDHDGVEQSTPSNASAKTSTSHVGYSCREQRAILCRHWRAGYCTRGDTCWFSHDIEMREQERQARERALQETRALALQEAQRLAEERREVLRQQDEERARELDVIDRARQIRKQEEDATHEAERQARLADVVKEDAAKTIQRVVLGSIVTFEAGLAIRNLIPGFESCTIIVRNLPADAQEREVTALFTQQGIDVGQFLPVRLKSTPDGKQEAHVVMVAECAHVLAIGLHKLEFRDEHLTFEVESCDQSANTGRNTDTLVISWRAPSERYVVEYADVALAERKAQEMDGRDFLGRRVKAEMHRPPPGRIVQLLQHNLVRLSNLPIEATDQAVRDFSGSNNVRRLKGQAVPIDAGAEGANALRREISRLAPISLKELSIIPPVGPSWDGIVTCNALFTSREKAQKVYDSLSGKSFTWIAGNSSLWLRLPPPIEFDFYIPIEQYRAQKTRWELLTKSTIEMKGCTLEIQEQRSKVRIRLAGSEKQEIGILRIKVDALLRGEKVDGWHRSFGFSENPFVRSVYEHSGTFLRTNLKKQSMRLYGDAQSIKDARAMIKAELERLASSEWTLVLQPESVYFFMRQGIPALREIYGDDAVRFAPHSRVVTVTGGDEVRHALYRMVKESLRDSPTTPSASSTHTCPICFDIASSPLRLGCEHVYCTACLRHFLVSAEDSGRFPLVCIGDDNRCAYPIPIPTIQRFLPPASFNRLVEVIFSEHISRHPQEFKYCKTPDCSQFYRATESPSVLHCPSCFSDVCSACHEAGHEGLTCAEQKARTDPAEQERLNELWMTKQSGRVKKCPECQVFIEKLDGCNHMSCRCGAHICWRCMGVFANNKIYDHLRTVHGGVFDIPDDL